MKVTKRKAKGVLADMIANMDEDSLARTREKMERITEDYCSQEVVKLLKERGFPFGYNKWVDEDATTLISQPIVCKWLREVKGIMIITYVAHYDNLMENNSNSYFSEMFNLADDLEQMGNTGLFATYEEAVEAALKYALENLI